jgi:hypothetical protein
VVLALVISTPLVLRIFASDINTQLFTTQLQRSKQQAVLEAGTKEQREANQVQKQINADQATLDGHIPGTVTSPQLQTAQAEVTKLTPEVQSAQQAEIAAREAWQCELYGDGVGCAGASNLAGRGPIAQAKEQAYNADLQRYQGLARELATANAAVSAAEASLPQAQAADLSRYQAQARQSLPGLKREYAQLETYIQSNSANGTKLNNEDTGLLAQLQALSAASAQNSGLEAARLAVLALFFLIEILPVTVKFLLNLGPLSTYEIVAKSRDDEITDSVHVHRVEKRRRGEGESKMRARKEEDARTIEDGKSKARLKVEEDMRAREADLGRQANEYVAGEMRKILELALQQWSDQVKARLSDEGGAEGGVGGTRGTEDGSPSGNGSSTANPTGHQSLGLPSGGNL